MISIYETFRTAIVALSANKGRSALTMLGVIIGVAAVILLISIGRGVQNYITDQFEALGSNLLFISPGRVSFDRDPAEALTRNKLDEKHIELIQRYAGDYIVDITPWINLGASIQYKTKNYYASVHGIDEVGFNIINFEIETGRSFTKAEVRGKRKVLVIGQMVVKELFPSENPIGKRVKVEDDTYEIIGTFKEKGQSYDSGIIMPHTAAADTFSIANYTNITMKMKDPSQMDQTIRQVERALLRDLKSDEFTILSQQDVLSSIQEILGVLTLGLGAIAGISLIVGGIGIMNIMLVSVTERTREIGLRKAIGAMPSDIATQFLLESMLLSVSGGVVGILLGWLGSLAGRGFIRTEVPWWAVLLAFSFAAFVGIIFGTYPAVKAGRKDPIEALRYE